ncbi:MAG TPA: aminoglycoside phosphotransferase family protein [Candidatus Limnocylindrales bacterium]|nr:aminoglycoside phosphotransferase family protein [Candidatus Limnocylindrales bacterium]
MTLPESEVERPSGGQAWSSFSCGSSPRSVRARYFTRGTAAMGRRRCSGRRSALAAPAPSRPFSFGSYVRMSAADLGTLRDVLQDVVRRLGLGADAIVEPASGGASGSAWMVRDRGISFVLRLGSSTSLTDGRLAAMAAARAGGLPVPELIRRTAALDGDAVLLSWLPGTSLHAALLADPAGTRRLGRLMGESQRQLHQIVGPAELIDVAGDRNHPFVAARGMSDLPEGDALLHLDWHPMNLLVDKTQRISGIVDWDNARRGHPTLDLARTHSLLTVEPSLASLPMKLRARVGELVDAWADGYGPEATAIPAACHAWAGRVMIADLEPRYADDPAALDGLRRWTEGWQART